MSFNTNNINSSIDQNVPVMAKIINNQLVEIRPLQRINSTGRVTGVDGPRIKVGNTTYQLATDASVFLHKDGKYKYVPVSELSSYNIRTLDLYASRMTASDTTIRVMTFSE